MAVCRGVHGRPTVLAHKEISHESTNKGRIHRALFQDKYLTFETNLCEVNVRTLTHSQAYDLSIGSGNVWWHYSLSLTDQTALPRGNPL